MVIQLNRRNALDSENSTILAEENMKKTMIDLADYCSFSVLFGVSMTGTKVAYFTMDPTEKIVVGDYDIELRKGGPIAT